MSNQIGKRGENIFSTIISRYIDPVGYMLAPTFLGDKFPTIDFHLDLLNYRNKKAFFYASVKTTTLGYNATKTKLNVTVNKTEIAKLHKFPIPVYLFGIDEQSEKGFLLCANTLSKSQNLNGLSTTYPIDTEHIKLLWKEVAQYWDNSAEITKFASYFK